MDSGLWFITPAWGRYEIVAICLEQRRRAIEQLARQGIEAHQVVIADDENLDIARGLGAEVVECPNTDEDGNVILGRRWNLGSQFAAKQGAEWHVQIGSDSWIDPAFFVPLTDPDVTLTSPAYAAVMRDRIATLKVSAKNLTHAAGPYVFHRSLMEPSDYAPCEEHSLFTDTSTVGGIERDTGRLINWQVRTLHAFQYVGFRVEPLMTTYRALWKRWGVLEYRNPGSWQILARYYPPDLVERARVVMSR